MLFLKLLVKQYIYLLYMCLKLCLKDFFYIKRLKGYLFSFIYALFIDLSTSLLPHPFPHPQFSSSSADCPHCREGPLEKAGDLSPQVSYHCNGFPNLPPASLQAILHTAAHSSFPKVDPDIITQTLSEAMHYLPRELQTPFPSLHSLPHGSRLRFQFCLPSALCSGQPALWATPYSTPVFAVYLLNWVGIDLHRPWLSHLHGGITYFDQHFGGELLSSF